MSFCIVATTRRLIAPHHELSCPWWIWRQLLAALRVRGRGVRESGAFLLGRRDVAGRAHIETFVLYDQLDPNAFDSGIIRFGGRYFGALWERCRRTSTTVVADVHTHPGGFAQSRSDQAHPMITQPNHMALIVPHFAVGAYTAANIGIYQYLGQGQWRTVPGRKCASVFHIGL